MNKVKMVCASLLVIALAGCGPTNGIPTSNPDHKAAQPGNGIIDKPARPKGMPGNAIAVNWHVVVAEVDSGERLEHIKANVTITAISPNAPVQGNVHGGYPFTIYTETPYTHTIWFQPGIVVNSQITATLDPLLGPGIVIECDATSGGHDVAVQKIISGGETCVSSLSTDKL